MGLLRVAIFLVGSRYKLHWISPVRAPYGQRQRQNHEILAFLIDPVSVYIHSTCAYPYNDRDWNVTYLDISEPHLHLLLVVLGDFVSCLACLAQITVSFPCRCKSHLPAARWVPRYGYPHLISRLKKP